MRTTWLLREVAREVAISCSTDWYRSVVEPPGSTGATASAVSGGTILGRLLRAANRAIPTATSSLTSPPPAAAAVAGGLRLGDAVPAVGTLSAPPRALDADDRRRRRL